jgi:hypothetical protein
MSNSVRSAFYDDDPPETGGFLKADFLDRQKHLEEGAELAAAAKERIRAAMTANQELVASGKGREPRPEKKPKTTTRTDLNAQAKKWMEAKGWKYARVDSWNAFAGVANDLLGMFDYLAFDLENGKTIGVQLTSVGTMSARRKKILIDGRFEWVKKCGWQVLVLGFAKGANGRFQHKEDFI